MNLNYIYIFNYSQTLYSKKYVILSISKEVNCLSVLYSKFDNLLAFLTEVHRRKVIASDISLPSTWTSDIY